MPSDDTAPVLPPESGPRLRQLAARASVIGTDTTIRRALPNKQLRMVGAWCFLDHAGPAEFAPGQGMHVGPHPHIGLQTFTWMIDGEVMHRDSLGCEQVIRPGQVNLMTAGRGIVHSEDSLDADGAHLHAAQLWIALPDSHQGMDPAFTHYPDLPVWAQGGARLTLLVGASTGRVSPVQVHTPLLGLDLCSGPEGADLSLLLDPGFEHAAMVLRGQARVQGEALAPGSLLDLGSGRAELVVQMPADSQLLLVGGAPFGPPPLLWWNFVARDQDQLEAALAEWQPEAWAGPAPAAGWRFGPVAGAGAGPLKAPSLAGVRLKSAG